MTNRAQKNLPGQVGLTVAEMGVHTDPRNGCSLHGTPTDSVPGAMCHAGNRAADSRAMAADKSSRRVFYDNAEQALTRSGELLASGPTCPESPVEPTECVTKSLEDEELAVWV